jgi:hypothetical protein
MSDRPEKSRKRGHLDFSWLLNGFFVAAAVTIKFFRDP